MTINLQQLQQHAAQADERPKAWFSEYDIQARVPAMTKEDARFIAACNPATITALCRAVQAALAYMDDDDAQGHPKFYDELDAALAPFRMETA